MPFVEDLTPFFALDDFAELVTVAGVTFSAVFDAEHSVGLDVAGVRPMLTCPAADVAGVSVGAAATVRGQAYTVREIQPDGTGVVALMLERN
jgi:hypothetical protein